MQGVSEYKRTSRVGTPQGSASLLVGVDGNYEGGLRPITGFSAVTDLEYGYGTDVELIATGGYKAGGVLKGIRGVTFRIDDNNYAAGYVYRVLSDDQTKAVIRLKVIIGQDTAWTTDYDLGFTQGLLGGSEPYNGEGFHAETFGRFVYVFRASKEPLVFYITSTNGAAPFTLKVVTDTGPGPAPTLLLPQQNSAGVKVTAGGGRTANKDVTDILTTMTPPASGDAEARMLFFGFSDVRQVKASAMGPDLTNPYAHVRNIPSPNQADDGLNGPSDLGLWVTPIQPDPYFGVVNWYQNGTPRTPAYAAGTYNEFYGLGYNRSGSPDEAPQGFTYPAVWAYRLFDTRTGRASPLSNRLEGIDEIYGRTAYEETLDSSGLNSNMAPVTFPMFQVIYDKTRYDTLLLYRSRRNTEGLDVDERTLSLERQITLSDYHIDSQPANTDWGCAAYFPVLTDGEITQQPIWQEPVSGDFLEEMPKAGSALAYEGIMLFGKMKQLDVTTTGLGKVMWSSLTEINPELVSVNDYYPLYTPDEEVERFCRSGPNVVGFTRLGSYMFRREANFMKGLAMHEGFGITGPEAACTVGSDIYFVTESGVNIIGQNGKLQDLSSLNYVIQNEWKSDLDKIQMAYDQPSSAVFIYNPVKNKACVLWLRTSRITEIWDMPFENCFSADVPAQLSVVGSRLQRRAAFAAYISPVLTTDEKWRIFVYDYAREKDPGSMLAPNGNRFFRVDGDWSFDNTILPVQQAVGLDSERCYLYVMEGVYKGVRIEVVRRNSFYEFEVVARANDGELADGTLLGLSPIYFQWIGPMLGAENAEGMQFSSRDYNSVRHVDSLRCSFTDIPDYIVAEQDHPKWLASIYTGTSELPKDSKFPTGNSRQPVKSVVEGLSPYAASFSDPAEDEIDPNSGVQGNVLFPSIRIFCPQTDYTLLSVGVHGTLRSEDSMGSRE